MNPNEARRALLQRLYDNLQIAFLTWGPWPEQARKWRRHTREGWRLYRKLTTDSRKMSLQEFESLIQVEQSKLLRRITAERPSPLDTREFARVRLHID